MAFRYLTTGICIPVFLFAASVTGIEVQSFYKPTICVGYSIDSTKFYDHVHVLDKIQCAVKCREDSACVSFLYHGNECKLGSSRLNGDCSNAVTNTRGSYYEKRQSCQNGGYLQDDVCICVDGYVGTTCERLMKDCSEGYDYTYYRDVYTEKVVLKIHPTLSPVPFQVKCWFVHGGRTYIQHRDDGTLNFVRNWNEYRDGFGDIDGDYWLGLEKIYYLTNDEPARLEYESHTKDYVYKQEYVDTFRIGNADSNYAVVTVTNEYGDLGQCMTEALGKSFSTPDRDNDGNCAQKFQSGWWFGSCSSCNPNGPITRPASGIRDGVEAEAFWKDINHGSYQIYMWLTAPY